MTWEIREGDCLESIRLLPDRSIDAVVTDPPYCSGAATESGRSGSAGHGIRNEALAKRRFSWFDSDEMTTGGLTWLLRSVMVEARPKLRPGASVIVFCDWRMLPMLAPAIESAGLRYSNLIVWDKESFGLGTGFRKQHELALHFTEGVGAYHDRSTGNVLRCPRAGRDRQHPTQKPVSLLQSIVRVVAPEGGVVLDPFAGSGSTGVACAIEGRQFVGVELSAEYARIARERIRAADPMASVEVAPGKVQQSLFGEVSA